MMRLKEIPASITRQAFAEKFSDIPINANGKASFSEPVSGGTVVYTLQFDADSLQTLILYVNEDFNEESHQNVLALTREIIALASKRGLGKPLEETPALAWKELIESPLPESGERLIVACRAQWKSEAATATLVYSWTWPGQLILEYRESQAA